MEKMESYDSLSKQQLIDRIRYLETQLNNSKLSTEHSIESNHQTQDLSIDTQKVKPKKRFEFGRYPTRKIALKVCYLGWKHGGLAWQPEITPLTTVEAELFRALLIARLVYCPIDLELEDERWRKSVDLEKWGYSRSGRTDAGVSGCDQIVSLWVRSSLSNKPLDDPHLGFRDPIEIQSTTKSKEEEEELEYHTILNSILPASVRVLAWSPVSTEFDARFSCISRHYKYFFSTYETTSRPPLDIEAMRDGANRLIGEHDFRNLCKLDKSKQINNFHRKIISAEINLIESKQIINNNNNNNNNEDQRFKEINNNSIYVLDLVGTAFLYNMVRHITSILFLIGSRLESPDVIDYLLYTDLKKPCPIEYQSKIPIDTKPEYTLSNSLPLLLYKCNYPQNTFNWITSNQIKKKVKSNNKGDDCFKNWSKYRIKTIIIQHFLLNELNLKLVKNNDDDKNHEDEDEENKKMMIVEPLGASEMRLTNNYIKLLNRKRCLSYFESNLNWLNGTGFRRLARKQEQQKQQEKQEQQERQEQREQQEEKN